MQHRKLATFAILMGAILLVVGGSQAAPHLNEELVKIRQSFTRKRATATSIQCEPSMQDYSNSNNNNNASKNRQQERPPCMEVSTTGEI